MLAFLAALPAADLPAGRGPRGGGRRLGGHGRGDEPARPPQPAVPGGAGAGGAVPHQHRARQPPSIRAQEAADPSAFALKIRRQLTDERRTLRVYGSEVVICRLTGERRGPAAPAQLRRARASKGCASGCAAPTAPARPTSPARAACPSGLRRRRRRDRVLAAAAGDLRGDRSQSRAVKGHKGRSITLSPARSQELPVGARIGIVSSASRRPCSTRP